MPVWDERYAEDGFAYGTEPNDFLKESVDGLQPGRALCLADGEGRNGVYLASQGFDVLSVDQSKVGLAKAEQLARERGCTIQTQAADLNDFDMGEEKWDVIVSVFAHMPPALRQKLHRGVVAGLKSGGVFILEAYHPDNIGRGTGGPPDVEMCVTRKILEDELSELSFNILCEIEREVNEGKYHSGLAAVTQAVAVKK
jgi:SAM-dependent methyltransferase